jgi:hypothetical protein
MSRKDVQRTAGTKLSGLFIETMDKVGKFLVMGMLELCFEYLLMSLAFGLTLYSHSRWATGVESSLLLDFRCCGSFSCCRLLAGHLFLNLPGRLAGARDAGGESAGADRRVEHARDRDDQGEAPAHHDQAHGLPD